MYIVNCTLFDNEFRRRFLLWKLNKSVQIFFSPLSWLFGGIVAARSELYERGVFKSIDLGVPVVSVGNLTVGGTGKTPLVAFIAKVLAENGHQVCVLTRGYKRVNPNERVLVSDGKTVFADAKKAGDEAVELANKLLGAVAVIADKNRAAAGRWALENLGATAFVLDDAFQHRQVKRDLDIVTIDATNPFGNGKLLPAGILREPVQALKRAGCVVLTRTDLAESTFFTWLCVKRNSSCPILFARTQIVGLREIKEFFPTPQNPKSKIALAFCALGNPGGFYRSLRHENFTLKATKSFPDHHVYSRKDVDEIERAARAAGAAILLTTAKDAVKLKNSRFELPCFVVEIEIVFETDEPLRKLLRELKFSTANVN